jgi:predicted nucleic acid-binding protein
MTRSKRLPDPMLVHLLDTSVWVDWFRGDDVMAQFVSELGDHDDSEIVTCGPVRMELLRGASMDEYPLVRDAMDLTRSVSVTELDFDAAASIYRSVRLRGHTIRSATDCLIAAIAERVGATLVHRDVDFARIGEVVSELSLIDLTA